MGGESARDWVGVYLKGLCMGAADAVPGVSGGTIALIAGIYERLVRAIAELDPTVLLDLRRVHDPAGRHQLYGRLVAMDVPFLVVLGLGVASAVVGVTRVVHIALGAYRALTFAFFFGVIAASAAVLYDQAAPDTPRRAGAAIAGFALAFFLSGVSGGGNVGHSPVAVFLVGAVAITAMILPGISGAFLLLLFGQYEFLSGTLAAFVDALLALPGGGRVGRVVEPGTTVVAFMLGAVLGLVSVAHAVRWALANYRLATLSFLVSLMVGALRLPVEEIVAHTAAWTVPTAFATVLVAGAGASLVVALDRYSDELDYAERPRR